jgi:hypothetical protein
MKYKTILSFLFVTAASLSSFELLAQPESSMSKIEYDRMDSLQAVYKRDQIQTQKAEDAETIRDAKADQVETEAKAKEADRVEDEAQDAAKQSKTALKTEKKAQKLRKDADKQADKAKAAREKSDLN